MQLDDVQLGNLRAKLRDFGFFSDGKKALKEILLVGAVPFDESPTGLWDDDELYLRMLVGILKEKNIALSTTFNITVANISPFFGGEDFLQDDFDADVVLLCYICSRPEIQFCRPQSSAELLANLGTGNIALVSSAAHYKLNAWRDATLRSGAKVVATCL